MSTPHQQYQKLKEKADKAEGLIKNIDHFKQLDRELNTPELEIRVDGTGTIYKITLAMPPSDAHLDKNTIEDRDWGNNFIKGLRELIRQRQELLEKQVEKLYKEANP